MSKQQSSDRWSVKPTREDLLMGADYAAISLPWTFNRMMKNTGAKGQRDRAWNIAKGVAGQNTLKRVLGAAGAAVTGQIKNHREDDLFDLRISAGGRNNQRFDVKTMHVYTDYEGTGRKPFSRQLVVENDAYDGPDWRRFFPMLVPHNQIGQDKDAYCFAIASSVRLVNVSAPRVVDRICAFPYGDLRPFLTNPTLCRARESAGRGFYVKLAVSAPTLFTREVRLTVLGEWDGAHVSHQVSIRPNKDSSHVGPFSCIASIEIDADDYATLSGEVQLWVSKNDFRGEVLNSSRENVNEYVAGEVLTFEASTFGNLVLPEDYTIHFLGWLFKPELLEAFIQYRSWVWPDDRANRFHNQPWSQLTERDRKTLEKLGISERIGRAPHRIRAGLLKGTGLNSGTCCYAYPNVFGGGLRETNLYVLPKDLRPMDELVATREA